MHKKVSVNLISSKNWNFFHSALKMDLEISLFAIQITVEDTKSTIAYDKNFK